MRIYQCFIVLLLALSASVQAELEFSSGSKQASLVELYTSEGCSSCPPADAWLADLLDEELLWSRVVPVAFHVDYWDYLGWPDRFAEPEYAIRQRQFRREGSVSGVYTPAIMVAGQEWRPWRRRSEVPLSSADVGDLTLAVDGDVFTAQFTPETQLNQPVQLHVAILGFGVKTSVRRGENRGRVLRHEFVVLGHDSFSADNLAWSGSLPAADQIDKAERFAVAAWVSPKSRQQPLQAVGGWLPNPPLR